MIPSGPPHIVDTLIAERAPRLAGSPLWPFLRPLLYVILDYAKARRMADAIAPMDGGRALAFISDLLSVKVCARGLERIPRHGRLVIVCNHPTGIADGVAVFDALKAIRPDLVFYANADAHRVCPGLDAVLVPVEWVEDKRTRERTRTTLKMTREAMDGERALVIFPAGRIARRQRDGTIADPEWAASALSVARKYAAPVAPIHLAGPRSTLFHLFGRFSKELRDITLFHELLNKRGKAFQITIGPLIPPGGLPPDTPEGTLALKRYIEQDLVADPERGFA